MDMNVIKGKWKEIKGDIQKQWGKITGDELEVAKGDANVIAGLIQQKYGTTKDEAHQKVQELMDKYKSSTPQSSTDMDTDRGASSVNSNQNPHH